MRNQFQTFRLIGKAAYGSGIIIDSGGAGDWRDITALRIGCCQVNIVVVVFQAAGPNISFVALTEGARFLPGSTVGRGIGGTHAQAVDDFIAGRQTPTVAVRLAVGTAVVFVLALVLYRELQTFDQAEEVIVTVGCHAVGTTIHKVVGFDVGVITELRQHIRPGADVIDNAVVAAVVE
ncbi:hypothetical protein D3C72_1351350 [compost metagenome]